MIPRLVGCYLHLQHDDIGKCYVLKGKYYEILKQLIEDDITGWIEVEQVFGARLFFRLEDVRELLDGHEEYAKAADAADLEAEEEERLNG